MTYSWKKITAVCCVLSALLTPAYAKTGDEGNSDMAVEVSQTQDKQELPVNDQPDKPPTVDLAVNMKVDGLHPKYSNRVPKSWHPVDTVDWQVEEQMVPQLLKRAQVTTEDTGGTLLFSDSPEYVTENGILYSDVVQGPARIFYYHLNNTRQNKKIAVVLEAVSERSSLIHVSREGISDPSDDYLWVGKTSQKLFMESKANRNIYVFPAWRKVLDEKAAKTVVEPGKLVNGIYDIRADEPVRISVVMCNANDDPVAFVAKAKVLPKDKHRLRGTYQGMNRIITMTKPYDPSTDGAVFIPLADEDRDTYRWGIDATDGSATQNFGNYGIMYEVRIHLTDTGQMQCLMNPRGGVYAGAMQVKTRGGRADNLRLVPRSRLFFGSKKYKSPSAAYAPTEDTAYIYQDSELENLGAYSGDMDVRLEFSPPGASNLPVYLIIMPASQAQGLAYKWETR